MNEVGKRIVVALLAVTVLLLLVDVARPSWTDPLRDAGAAVFTPVQQALRGWDQDDLDEARAEQDRLQVEVEQLRAELEAEQRASRIEVPAGLQTQVLIRSRVVASSPSTSPVGSKILTLDSDRKSTRLNSSHPV